MIYRQLFSFKKKEIDQILKAASKKASIPGLKLLKSPGDTGRLLIIIPKATGTAYRRNKLKRQIKSIFYEEKLYEVKRTWVLIVYKAASELNFDEIKEFLKENIN